MKKHSPIGIFDSGYGGLTVMKEIVELLPEYDYIYLGDNARTPYGTRSYANVHEFTLEGIHYLFNQGCPLVILACNTASAKALRTIQQRDLPLLAPENRVLGVVRPTTEVLGYMSNAKSVGVFATKGTVDSQSYVIELEKFFPDLKVTQESCPMWVPLIENGELDGDGVEYFVKAHIRRLLQKDDQIDTILLGCTHYPLLGPIIQSHLPANVSIVNQGQIVANSLADYLGRHTEMDKRLTRGGHRHFCTTDNPDLFSERGGLFYGKEIEAELVEL
ncbi:MAG: glutamate racemase [Cyclobacteriaceae bacterium]